MPQVENDSLASPVGKIGPQIGSYCPEHIEYNQGRHGVVEFRGIIRRRRQQMIDHVFQD